MLYKPQVVPPTLNGTELTFTEIVKNLYQNLSVVIRIPLIYVLAVFRITESRRHGDHIGHSRRSADVVDLGR